MEYPWERLDYSLIDSSDGIVVLSSGRHFPPGDSKIIEWSDPDRFFAGVDLFKANKSKKLIFTGGASPLAVDLPLEGDTYIKEALKMGIPRTNLYTTKKVFNTIQEAKAVNKLLNQINDKQKNIILVTSAFHMRRAKNFSKKKA